MIKWGRIIVLIYGVGWCSTQVNITGNKGGHDNNDDDNNIEIKNISSC